MLSNHRQWPQNAIRARIGGEVMVWASSEPEQFVGGCSVPSVIPSLIHLRRNEICQVPPTENQRHPPARTRRYTKGKQRNVVIPRMLHVLRRNRSVSF